MLNGRGNGREGQGHGASNTETVSERPSAAQTLKRKVSRKISPICPAEHPTQRKTKFSRHHSTHYETERSLRKCSAPAFRRARRPSTTNSLCSEHFQHTRQPVYRGITSARRCAAWRQPSNTTDICLTKVNKLHGVKILGLCTRCLWQSQFSL